MIKINPPIGAIRYHEEKVSEILDKISRESIGRGLLNDSTRKFIKRYKNILIKGKPQLLLKIHQKFNTIITDQDFENLKTCFKDRGYGKFQNDYGKEFLEKLGIDTCVYCNRNYTIQLLKDRARAELDHWFPKESFPILALSFYNLIPSCHSCNHIKHNKAPLGGWENALDTISHPYLEDARDVFSFSYFYESLHHPRVTLKSPHEKALKTISFSKIDQIYKSHSNRELRDLIDLRYKYSKNYLDILCNKTFEDLHLSQEEAYRMVFGIEVEEENFHKRPFSKFKKDIIEELLKIK